VRLLHIRDLFNDNLSSLLITVPHLLSFFNYTYLFIYFFGVTNLQIVCVVPQPDINLYVIINYKMF